MALFLCLALLFGSSSAQIKLNQEVLTVELATDQHSHYTGLMHRSRLPDGHGMLFIFPTPRILSFWMKNVQIPLSIAFFDENKQLLNIEEMEVPLPHLTREPMYKFYLSKKPACYALEVPERWFERHQIKPGSSFEWIGNSALKNPS